MFIARGLLKFAEEDVWNDGCQPDTMQNEFIDMNFTGKTPQEVIQKVADFLGVDDDAIERNACDEKGRVDFALTEGADGSQLSTREVGQWKRGEIKAWYAVYTAYIEKITPARL